jgi:hypothetical protein
MITQKTVIKIAAVVAAVSAIGASALAYLGLHPPRPAWFHEVEAAEARSIEGIEFVQAQVKLNTSGLKKREIRENRADIISNLNEQRAYTDAGQNTPSRLINEQADLEERSIDLRIELNNLK